MADTLERWNWLKLKFLRVKASPIMLGVLDSVYDFLPEASERERVTCKDHFESANFGYFLTESDEIKRY